MYLKEIHMFMAFDPLEENVFIFQALDLVIILINSVVGVRDIPPKIHIHGTQESFVFLPLRYKIHVNLERGLSVVFLLQYKYLSPVENIYASKLKK